MYFKETVEIDGNVYPTIFAKEAHHYWKLGLSAIPLHYWSDEKNGRKMGKAPITFGWERFHKEMPTEEEMKLWVETVPLNNIGLVAGNVGEIAFFDIDSDDPRVYTAVRKFIPNWVWERRGKKGCVVAFRIKKEQMVGKFSIKNSAGSPLLEILGNRAQVVLPPSIHPDTLQPYTANAPLYEVFNDLPWLTIQSPQKFEEDLRNALKETGLDVSDRTAQKIILNRKVSKGGRDNHLVSLAGAAARNVLNGVPLQEEWNHLFSQIDLFVEDCKLDPVDREKAGEKFMEFLKRDITKLKKTLPHGWDAGIDPDLFQAVTGTLKPEDMEWSAEQIVADVTKWRKEHGGIHTPPDVTQKKLNEVLDKMARSPKIMGDEVVQEYIITAIAPLLPLGVKASTMKKQLKKNSAGVCAGENHAEVALAVIKRISDLGEVRTENGFMYQWNGTHWGRLDDSEIRKTIALDFGHTPAGRKYSDHSGIQRLILDLSKDTLKKSETVGVNFLNGFLDTSLELHPHDPKYGCTYTLPFEYLPHAQEPEMFTKAMRSAWQDNEDCEDMIESFYEFICAAVFGLAPRFQRAGFLWGPSGTGKTVIIDVVRGLFPIETQCALPPEEWGKDFMAITMKDKLLNFCLETNESIKVPGKQFKEIIEGSPMIAQQKYKEAELFTPVCAHLFGGNHLPRTADTSTGFTRRWLIWKFNRKIPRNEQIPGYQDMILEREAEQIMSYAVKRILRLLSAESDGYLVPKTSEMYEEMMARNNNPVRTFMAEWPKVVTSVHLKSNEYQGKPLDQYDVSLEQLYTEYTLFCVERGARTTPIGRFKTLIEDLCPDFDMLIYEDHDRVKASSRVSGVIILKDADSRSRFKIVGENHA